ncbi:hypothetical protein CR513_36883, partial [Mucuna pruriens]
MTRSSSKLLHAFDLEIERTLHCLRKVRHTVTPNSSSYDSLWNSENSNFTIDESNFFEHQETRSMENNDRTLKEWATPDVVYQPLCIQCPPLEPAQSYELKSSLIHLLPKFHGVAGEDPHKHLKEFHVVCSTMRSQGIPKDHTKMNVFPFSLDGVAKDWLYLQPVLFNTWGDMKCMFLEKLFPTSRTTTLRKEICGIRQHSGETLHEYWERFNKLCTTCPHHQISKQLLVQYFYEGLMMMNRSIIDAESGGALMDKTLVAARHLISNMASNMQQFGTRGTIAPIMVNEFGMIDNPRLENQLIELTSLVRQLAIGQHQPIAAVKACGIVLQWSTLLTCAPRCKRLSWTIEKVATSTESSHMQTGHLRANNLDGHHTGRIQIKGRMQLKDSVQTGACLIAKAAINNRIQDTRCHRSNSSSSSRKRQHQVTHHLWMIS